MDAEDLSAKKKGGPRAARFQEQKVLSAAGG
jgi:hypothetical protein